MSYYVRAFCATEQVPSVQQMQEWLAARDVHLTIEGDDPAANWKTVTLGYKPGKQPIVLECSRVNDPADPLGKKEIDSFLKEVGSPGSSHVKRRVVQHLKKTSFTIACRLPREDMDEDGWDANGQILAFLAENCRALIHADGEGFYERSSMILKMA